MENQRSIQGANFDLVNTYFGIDTLHTYDGIYVRLRCRKHMQPNMYIANITELCMFIFELDTSEYDQEIPQSQTADSPLAPRGLAAQPSRDTSKTN